MPRGLASHTPQASAKAFDAKVAKNCAKGAKKSRSFASFAPSFASFAFQLLLF
jgi:hypothetical protein